MNLGGMGNQAATSQIQQQIAASAHPELGDHEMIGYNPNAIASGSGGGVNQTGVQDSNEMIRGLGDTARNVGMINAMSSV